MGDFEGKVALITGGARGLGRASALALARAGADIAIADLAVEGEREGPFSGKATASELDAVVTECEALGRRAIGLRVDVTEAGDCERMAADTLAAFGRVDLLFANAGIAGGEGSFWEIDEADWDRVIAVDLKGVWLSAKYVVPHMIERGYGKVLITSSRSGVRAEEKCAHYVAAKHGVVGLAKALAIELGPYEINVNALCPSGMGKIAAADYDPSMYGPPLVPYAPATAAEFDQLYGKLNLFESVGRAEFDEVAEAVVWLLSDRARLVTGMAFLMDAGYVAKRGG